MWKLTISQKNLCEYESEGEKKSFTSVNSVEVKSKVLGDLLILVQDAERLQPADTEYKIERVDE